MVLDQLAPTGPVVLAGHSMGGMTIMALAAARPELFGDRVRGVALVSTAAGDLTSDPRSAGGRMARLSPGMLSALLAGARVLERLRQLLPPDHPRHQKMVRTLLYGADATDEMVLAGAEIMHASTVRSFLSFMPALGEHDKREELAALTRVPVEILVGDSDKLTPRRHSRQLAEALPDAELHEVERTGHMLTQERPQLVTDAIERLVAAAVGGPGRRVRRTIGGMTGSPAPEPARLRRSAGDRRAQLVQIGLELLPTTPVQELTIDEVARRAGISRSLLFHYFATKREYYTAVTRAAADLLWEHLLPRPGTPPDELVAGMLDRYVGWVETYRETHLAFVRGAARRRPVGGRGVRGDPRAAGRGGAARARPAGRRAPPAARAGLVRLHRGPGGLVGAGAHDDPAGAARDVLLAASVPWTGIRAVPT